MGVLEAAARIVQLGGSSRESASVAKRRARFEARTGAFAPEDAWFEERSRAFWCDAVTRGRFGREVEHDLSAEDRRWLEPLERAHRGLFQRTFARSLRHHRPASERALAPSASLAPLERAGGAVGGGEVLVDVWSGAEIVVTAMDDASHAELEAAAGQLLDARVVGAAESADDASRGVVVALLPGAVFHPPHAAPAIHDVLSAARASGLSTHDTLDALLRMERTLRALSRVKTAYAYRPEALSAQPSGSQWPVRRAAKEPK
jgi:hypothetical protein